jgi:hypothetical protein
MLFATEIYAICPFTNELKKYRGPNVEAIGTSDAYVQLAARGIQYATVTGAIIREENGSIAEGSKLLN